jgi:regulator of replication initiation timing
MFCPQAKIQDLHQQIEELTQKVGNLQTENAALHSRTSILEKVLDMRNEQIQVMQESKEVSCISPGVWGAVC